ncbi:MAG: cytochrome c oxidase accessory protein CcoG [Flavobacteriales bacterium]
MEPLKDESFRDSITTIDKKGKRAWIYAMKPKGKFYNLRTYASIVYLIVFFSLPFIKINGEPIILLNVLERKFIILGFLFRPQDFFLFMLSMLTFLVFIVLFTAIFGRLFCGWACPQTVFMEMVFRKIEYWIEGDANKQRALKAMPWNREKIIKRVTKASIFFIVSFIIANTFLAYIISKDKLFQMIAEPMSMHLGSFMALLLFTGVFFFVFYWFREQVCLVVCPYGRLQGVLLDKNSIVVAYDYVRGEPRGHLKKNETRSLGDCVDCAMCVKVCPTGIDIRNGTQLECVNCTACIDACNNVMDKVGLPTGLIRYASEANIAKGEKLKVTPRIIGYSVVLLALIVSLGFGFTKRGDFDATILRTPGMLYHLEGENHISNLYNIKIVNKTRKEYDARIELIEPKGEIRMVGNHKMHLSNAEIASGEFFVIIHRDSLKERKTKIKLGIFENEQLLKTVETTFLGTGKVSVNDNQKQLINKDRDEEKEI